MLILFSLLLAGAARAAGQAADEPPTLPPPAVRPLFRVAHVGPDGTLFQLDEDVLDRLLHRSKPGDPFTIPLPDSDAVLAFDQESLDPKRDLDCCSVSLSSPEGEARIPLTRRLSVRDFDVTYGGKVYRFRASGNGNFLVR